MTDYVDARFFSFSVLRRPIIILISSIFAAASIWFLERLLDLKHISVVFFYLLLTEK